MNWQMLQHFPLGNAHLTRYNIGVMNQSGARVSDTTHFHTGTPDFKEELYAPVSYNCKRNKRNQQDHLQPLWQKYSGNPRGSPRGRTGSIQALGLFLGKDNRLDEFDLCEQCYDEIISEFKIKI